MKPLESYQLSQSLLARDPGEPLSEAEYTSLCKAVSGSLFTASELETMKERYPADFKRFSLSFCVSSSKPRGPRLTVHFTPGFSGEILVHAVDNGIVMPMEDSGSRHAGNVLMNTIAFGPLALMSPKNIAMVCHRCETEFARNVYAYKRQEKINRFIASGVLVVRQHSEPAAVYDPTAEHA